VLKITSLHTGDLAFILELVMLVDVFLVLSERTLCLFLLISPSTRIFLSVSISFTAIGTFTLDILWLGEA
jgi:hypothetical protein